MIFKATHLTRCALIAIPFFSILSATWFDDISREIVLPDGSSLACYVTGDQYLRRLHDENDYTIVLNKDDGFYYYAEKNISNELVPSTYKVESVDPREIGIESGLSLGYDEYLSKKNFYDHNNSGHRPNRDAPSSGEITQINVFIRFADDPDFPQPRAYYDEVFQTELDEPSLRHYYLDISHDSLTVNTKHYPGTFTGTNTAYIDSYNRAYYEPFTTANTQGYNSDNERSQREHALLANALNSISSNISPSVNVDANDDGFVDAVSFVIYGTPGDWSDLLWPHRWSLYSQDVTINGAQVYDYLFMLSESWYFNVGVLSHEFGHVLGAPDYYHYSSSGAPTPVGGWDLMASNSNPPQFPSAFTRWKYFNWGELTEITQSGTYTLNSLHEVNNNAFKIASANSDSEYFVVEYRKQEGMYDANAVGNRSGLVIYRVNTEAGNGNAQGPPDELYVYRPGGSINSNGNFETAPFSSDYGLTEFNDNSDPACFLYNNGNSADGGLNIYDISSSDETISFTVSFGYPELVVIPENLSFDLQIGESQNQVIEIKNNGDSETVLNYEASLVGEIPFNNPQGGPDQGGYYWSTVSDENEDAVANWIDLTDVGIPIVLNHNDYFANQVIDLPFDFTFFNESYNYVQVNANGWIGWDSANEQVWLNDELPSTNLPRPAIFGFFDDLNPNNTSGNSNSSGDIYYHSNDERVVVWFDNVVRWNTTDWGEYDFQIIIYPNGSFDINYNTMNGTLNSGTVGYQNQDGSQGTQIVANQQYVSSDMSIMVKAVESEIPWGTLTSETNSLVGILNGQESNFINLQLATGDLSGGIYTASVNVSSLDADPVSIPVNLNITDGEIIPQIPILDLSSSITGIVALPNGIDSLFSNVADRYTHLQAPNGDYIQFLIQDEITEEMAVHARSVLESFLSNIPNSNYGSNKSVVANSIASSNAIMLLLNDEDEYDNPYLENLFDSGIKGQDLLSTEIFTEGVVEYNQSSARNATYEEILHFIHGYGIQPAIPWMQTELVVAMNQAIENDYYNPLSDLPVEDYDEEYLAMGLECYFGLWAHNPNGDGYSGDNEYAFNTRQAMELGDPQLYDLIKDFFGESLLYTPFLPDVFEGTFSISYSPEILYTSKSQYLDNVSLSGALAADILGNDKDNRLEGNLATNHFNGGAGDDLIIGHQGIDRSVYVGVRDEYILIPSIDILDSSFQIIDLIPNRDGIDTLYGIEELEFNSVVYSISEMLGQEQKNSVPDNYLLKSPYPNPFNPITQINFEVPEQSFLTISVYNLNGELIKVLTEKEYSSGRYQLNWNAENQFGQAVSTGMYFIRLSSGSFNQTKKILFLK